MWENVEDHEGFVLAGCPGTVDDQSRQAPTPIAVENSSYIERFLQKRAEVIRLLSQHIQEIADHAPAGLPAVQAASCLLRECIPQRSVRLLRVLESDSTKEFCISVDETVLKAAKRILDLPELLDWQNEALFIPVDRGGLGRLMEARATPPRKKNWRHDRSRSPDQGAERLGSLDPGLGGLDERK